MAIELGEQRQAMEQVADELVKVLNPLFARHDLGFALIAFSKESPGFQNFRSNVTRDRLIEVMIEFTMRLEKGDLLVDGDAEESKG